LLLGSVADSTDISIDAAAARHAERVNFGPTVSRSNAVVHNCIDLRKRWGRQKEDGRTDGRTDRCIALSAVDRAGVINAFLRPEKIECTHSVRW